MMKRYFIAATATFMLAGTGSAITEKDRKIADEFLKLPGTIQFIEADKALMELSPEEMYDRLEKDGVIDGIKEQRATEKFIKEHPDRDLFEAGQKKVYRDYQGMTRNNILQLPVCVAKRSGTFQTFIGIPSVSPWCNIFPLIDCVTVAKKQGWNPNKCIIAGCTPLYFMPDTSTVAHMVRDILLGLYN